MGTTRGYRTGVENKPNIDRIKPNELEKLEAVANIPQAALGTVEIALYTPAIEFVFRYKDGDVSINKRLAFSRS